MRLRHMLL